MASRGDRLEGRNVVLEALKAGRTLRWLRVDERARRTGGLAKILDAADAAGLAPRYVPRADLDTMSETGSHNGVIAEAEPLPPVALDTLLTAAARDARWLLAFDERPAGEDMGAILRTADAAGARGVLLPGEGGVPAGARRVAMGAAEHLPMCETDVAAALADCRRGGLRVVALSFSSSATPYAAAELTGPTVFVVPGGESGVPHRAVRGACDAVVGVGPTGSDARLPLSAAAAVLFYEWVRQN